MIQYSPMLYLIKYRPSLAYPNYGKILLESLLLVVKIKNYYYFNQKYIFHINICIFILL